MQKTRGLYKKLGDTREHFMQRWAQWRTNGMDVTEAEDVKRGGKNTQKNYTKKILMTQITMMVWSLTESQTSWSVKSSGP